MSATQLREVSCLRPLPYLAMARRQGRVLALNRVEWIVLVQIDGTKDIAQALYPSDTYVREGDKVQLHRNGTLRKLAASSASTEERPEDDNSKRAQLMSIKENYDLTQAERKEPDMPGRVSSEVYMPALVSCDDDSSDKTPAPVNRRGQRTAWICTNCGS